MGVFNDQDIDLDIEGAAGACRLADPVYCKALLKLFCLLDAGLAFGQDLHLVPPAASL